MNTSYRVASNRRLARPPVGLKTLQMRHGPLRVGMSGGFFKPGELLPESFIEFATGKMESNGQSLLQNLIADGSVVDGSVVEE